MIKIGLLIVSALFYLLNANACTPTSTNPCRSMQENIEMWSIAYCEQKTMEKVDQDIKNNCCDCWCLLSGRMADPLAQQCECIEPSDTSGQPCKDNDLELANNCLSDLDACKIHYVIEPYESVCFASP